MQCHIQLEFFKIIFDLWRTRHILSAGHIDFSVSVCVFSLPHSFIKGPFKVEIPTPHASLKMKKVVYSSRAKTE